MTREEILALCEAEPTDDAPALVWSIEDRDTLERAMGILAEAAAESAAIKRSAAITRAEALRRIDSKEAGLLRRVTRSVQIIESAVEGYARAHRKELIPGKRKTASLIHGDISYRDQPERFVVEDEAVALEWCRSQPVEADLVRVTYEINKVALAAHYRATGAIPPGCVVPPTSETITIKPEAPDTIEAAPSRREIQS